MQLFPGATFRAIRGNLDTRLRKLDNGEFNAVVLAAAGLRRLGRHARISAVLPPEICLPAPGQGIIAVETRRDDAAVRAFVDRINDPTSASALAAERMVVLRLGGGCQMPIGAYATVSSTELSLSAMVISLDGARVVRAEASGAVTEPEAVGRARPCACWRRAQQKYSRKWRAPAVLSKDFNREATCRVSDRSRSRRSAPHYGSRARVPPRG